MAKRSKKKAARRSVARRRAAAPTGTVITVIDFAVVDDEGRRRTEPLRATWSQARKILELMQELEPRRKLDLLEL